ncbi:MAG: hypothetical protein MJE77_28900 [Proteobacteria bacterium]|nr:hypothetical protein [Pseudomonadota bacterium]
MKRVCLIVLGLLVGACGSESNDALDGINSITFVQRPARGGVGNVFNYESYVPGARIVQLSPPTADGELKVLCCDQFTEFAEADIFGYDVSFDAREIVFSAKLSREEPYGLFVYSIESDEFEPLPTDPNHDYVTPIFLPGNKIMFMTNAVVEDRGKQHLDEYDQDITLQIGIIDRDGGDEELGARNLSHRVFPSLMSDGRVIMTQWDHVGEVNNGRLMVANPDMTTFREGFGKEGTGVANSFIKAVEVSPGRVVAIGTARERTLHAGTVIDVRMGKTREVDGEVWADIEMAEKNGSYNILTPQVPIGREPSSQTIGRYHDAYPLNARDYPDLLVSWADGPVESATLSAAGLNADFGIYLFNSSSGARRPIWNQEEYWDILPRPFRAREAPPVIEASGSHRFGADTVLLGSMNVYESTQIEFAEKSVYGIRVIEGFGSEEGFPRNFGMTEHDGAAMLGVAEVRDDGSWAALIPANIPVRQQAIDRFGMALISEPVWISGRGGEARFCGGCHEDRTKTTVIDPGITDALGVGPDNLRTKTTRYERRSTDYSVDKIVGVPWDKAVQQVFTDNCVRCHDGTARPGNPSYTVTDTDSGETFTWYFNLNGDPVDYGVGDTLISGYTTSYMTLMGPNLAAEFPDRNIEVTGEIKQYIEPGSARDSELIQKLNPPQLLPFDSGVRAFPDRTPHGQELGAEGFELTRDEYHILILMADMGGQFYSRENVPQ